MIVFDLDGTLFTGAVDGAAWADSRALKRETGPDFKMCDGVRRLVSPVVVVTGRSSYVYGTTQEQLLAVFPHVELHTRPLDVPFEELARWKAETLRLLGCTLYVGDSAVDREAAKLAGALHCLPETFLAFAEGQTRVIA